MLKFQTIKSQSLSDYPKEFFEQNLRPVENSMEFELAKFGAYLILTNVEIWGPTHPYKTDL